IMSLGEEVIRKVFQLSNIANPNFFNK
ncbi:hypothetical protein EVA_15425, partial [gut metagenome]